jgi:formylglycine-generating enzyme
MYFKKNKSIIIFLSVVIMIFCCLFCKNSANADNKNNNTASVDYSVMITVPAITDFYMGFAGISEPAHKVPSISSFKIGKYEVTYDRWFAIKKKALELGYIFGNPGREGTSSNQSDPSSKKFEPVTSINWHDCIVWCNSASEIEGLTPVYYKGEKHSPSNIYKNSSEEYISNNEIDWNATGYRLPTEAEWEAASRYLNGKSWLGGDIPSGLVDNSPADGSWRIEISGDWMEDDAGDDYSELNAVAFWVSNSKNKTHVTGLKNANNLGIHDMTGNVWEWCWDWHQNYLQQSPFTDSNTKGPLAGSTRIIRGGGWNSSANECRTSYRAHISPYNKYDFIGFRLVCSVP